MHSYKTAFSLQHIIFRSCQFEVNNAVNKLLVESELTKPPMTVNGYHTIKQITLSIFVFLYLVKGGQAQNRFFEKDVPRLRNQIFISLPQNNQLYVSFNHWAELDIYGNVDSLLQLYKRDLTIFKESTSTEYHKLLFVIEENGNRSIIPFFNAHQQKGFNVTNGQLVERHEGYDTLIIERKISSINKLHLPRNIRVYLLVNHLDEISRVDSLNQRIQQARKLAAQHPKKELLQPRYVSYVEVGTTSLYPASGRFYNSMPRKIIRLGMGTGITQNEIYTTLSGDFTVVPELKQVGFRLGWDEYFHFQNSLSEFSITRSSFVNAGLVFFQRWPLIRIRSLSAPPERGAITLGYLIRGNNNFFVENTWRLASRISLTRQVKLEPELYWNGFFKQAYPGIRLSANFFTNE